VSERIIYIGRKPIVKYIEAVLRAESGKAIISARGNLISKAVSVALATKRYGRMVGRSIEIGRIEIGSIMLGDPPKRISVIRIEVELE